MVPCQIKLVWNTGEMHECPGAAVCHILFADGSILGACFDCLKLTLTDGAYDTSGNSLGGVAFHSLRDGCFGDEARWVDRGCRQAS